MITKVYESITEKHTRIVKKIQKVEKTVTYTDYESRSQRVYEPPTGVSCCLRCGTYLKNSMWVYGKSGKYLCKSCWYSCDYYEREEYAEEARRKSEGGYSYKSISVPVIRTKTVYEDKEVEEEEEYSTTKTLLVNPIDIEYPKNNIIKRYKLNNDFTENLSYFPFSNDLIEEEKEWYGRESLEKSIESISKYKPLNKLEMVGIFNMDEIPYSEYIIDEKQTVEERGDVVGFYPNVPAYIQGHPLNMYNIIRKNIVTIDRVVNIYLNLALDSKLDVGHYNNRGIIVYSLINDLLFNKKLKVQLKLCDATFIEGETLLLQLEPIVLKMPEDNDENYLGKKQKLEESLSRVYNMLTDISFYRLVIFNEKVHLINKNKLNSGWNNGYGFCLKNKYFREILEVDDDVLVFGNIEEHKIGGLFRDDDFANTIESIGLYCDYGKNETRDQKYEIVRTCEEVIKSRGITKLIHFTAEENVESIKSRGLVPVNTLDTDKIEYHSNDPLRLDEHTDAVCLSVSEPNGFLLREYQNRHPNTKYKIIEIKPEILLLPCKRLYSDYNAASRFSRKSEDNFEIMFQDKIHRRFSSKNRNDKELYAPTSEQAEILFCGIIPPEYIIKIIDISRDDIELQTKNNKRKAKSVKKEGISRSVFAKELGISSKDFCELLEKIGWFESVVGPDGKHKGQPTKIGIKNGIFEEKKNSNNEEYIIYLLDERAQKTIKRRLKK